MFRRRIEIYKKQPRVLDSSPFWIHKRTVAEEPRLQLEFKRQVYVCNEVAEYARQTTRVRGQQTPYKKAMREDDKELRERDFIFGLALPLLMQKAPMWIMERRLESHN